MRLPLHHDQELSCFGSHLAGPLAASIAVTFGAVGAAAETTEPTDTVAEASEDTVAEASGDSASSVPAEPLRIGFLPPSLEIPAFQGLWHGIEGYGGEVYGDEVVAVDAKNDPTVQVQTIEQWVELDQVDAIWVIPVAGDAIAPAIEAATEAGVAVIAGGVPADYGFDGPIPGITFSAIDNVDFGKGIGDLMAACINERLGRRGVGDLRRSEHAEREHHQHQRRARGGPRRRSARCRDRPGVGRRRRIMAGTQQAVESALQGNPDSNGFMAGDAESTMAGLNAYSGAGMDPTEICIVGNGGTEDQIAAVEAGELYGVVAFDFVGDLAQNVDELHRLAADPSAEGQQLTVPISIIES